MGIRWVRRTEGVRVCADELPVVARRSQDQQPIDDGPAAVRQLIPPIRGGERLGLRGGPTQRLVDGPEIRVYLGRDDDLGPGEHRVDDPTSGAMNRHLDGPNPLRREAPEKRLDDRRLTPITDQRAVVGYSRTLGSSPRTLARAASVA